MNLFKETLTSIVRKLLVMLFGWIVVPLIAHEWIGSDLGDRLRAAIDNWAMIIVATALTFITPLVWGWWNKVVAKTKILIAAQLRPDSATESRIEKDADSLPKTEKLRLATSPGR